MATTLRKRESVIDEDVEYDRRAVLLAERLRPLLTDEFLTTLSEAVLTCGWSLDMVESVKFAEWCFDAAGKPRPDCVWRCYQDELPPDA